MKKVNIYQINTDRIEENGNKLYLFLGWKFASPHFLFNDYDLIYSCYRDDEYTLEDCFTEFNISRPEDFTGHSLSVSDVVEMEGKFYYCDGFGWVDITEEL